jgi:hypothetical protein
MTSDMASGINDIDNVNTNPGLNTVASTPGNSNVPITSGAGSRNQFPNPNNVGTDGGTLTDNNQPLEESTSLNSGITPSTRDANTNLVLDKESIIRSKLQELNEGDRACNRLYDKTIITWKNIVDRTKDIVENFS